MKIGIYDPYLDDIGGGERYMMTAAECLSQDHDVSVFWNRQEDIERIIERFSLDLSRVTFASNIFSRSVGFLARILETRKYDCMVILSDGSIPFVLSKKLFLHLQQPLDNFNGKSLKGRLKLSRVTGIFCNSNFTKSFNENRFDIQTRVIYPPVVLHPRKIKKENIILTVGRLRVKNVQDVEDYKKIPTMIEAFKEIVRNGLTGWKFVIATSIQEEDRDTFEILQKIAHGFPIEFRVNLKNEDLWKEYSIAKIYWHATGHGEDLARHPEFAEHFGISTVEAMGAGAVPVVINAGGQKEVVTEGSGILWNTPSELQEYTLRLTRDKKLWEEMSAKAKVRAHYFAGDRFCKEIRELIEA